MYLENILKIPHNPFNNNSMKTIAIPVAGEKINDHFGHSDVFRIINLTERNKVISVEEMASTQGCGCKSQLAEALKEKGVSLVLAGNMGAGAQNKLKATGIEVLTGFSGTVEEVLHHWASDSFSYQVQTCSGGSQGHHCSHHH